MSEFAVDDALGSPMGTPLKNPQSAIERVKTLDAEISQTVLCLTRLYRICYHHRFELTGETMY